MAGVRRAWGRICLDMGIKMQEQRDGHDGDA